MAIQQKHQKKQANFAQASSSPDLNWQPGTSKSQNRTSEKQAKSSSVSETLYLRHDLLRTLIAAILAAAVLGVIWFVVQ